MTDCTSAHHARTCGRQMQGTAYSSLALSHAFSFSLSKHIRYIYYCRDPKTDCFETSKLSASNNNNAGFALGGGFAAGGFNGGSIVFEATTTTTTLTTKAADAVVTCSDSDGSTTSATVPFANCTVSVRPLHDVFGCLSVDRVWPVCVVDEQRRPPPIPLPSLRTAPPRIMRRPWSSWTSASSWRSAAYARWATS